LTTPAAKPGAAHDADLEKTVGRGALLLTLSKFWFLASGFVIQALLAKVMRIGVDDEEGKRLYGVYSTATGFAAILNAFVYQGTTQAVATFTGRSPQDAGAVKRAAFGLQAVLGGGLFAAWFLAAPWIALKFHDNDNLATPFRYASFILLGYAFYAVPMGSFTGRKLFVKQAIVDVAYSTLKIVGIVGCAYFLGAAIGRPEAACAGFAAASFAVLAMSLWMTPPAPKTDAVVAAKDLFRFQIFTMLLAGLVTWVTQADLQLLNRYSPGDATAVERIAGEYRAAQLFATIPYQAVFAITFILFPLVSGLAAGETEKLRGYVRQTTKYALIIATAIAACFVAAPVRAVRVLYGVEYEPAGPALRVLVLGYVAFSVFFIMMSVVTASGRPLASALLVAVIAAVQFPLSAGLIKDGGGLATAEATTAAMCVGLVAMQLYHRRRWGSGLHLPTAAKTLVSGAVAGVVVHVLLDGATFLGRPGFLAGIGGGLVAKLVTVVVFGAGIALFVGLLLFLNVLDADDRAKFARVLGRGKARA
jgi:O-antigen/teichoic acid export membrane protein